MSDVTGTRKIGPPDEICQVHVIFRILVHTVLFNVGPPCMATS